MTSHSLDVPLDPIRQEEIDLLVEGELSPPERDELVARFDRDGNGWRRCALAFMERDALRGSLAAIRHRSEHESGSNLTATKAMVNNDNSMPNSTSVRRSASRRTMFALCATAATMMIVIGMGIRSWLRPESTNETALSPDVPRGSDVTGPIDSEQNPDVWLQVSNAVNRLSVADGEVIAVVGVPREHAQIEFLPIIQSESIRKQILELPKPDLPRGYQQQAARAGWKFDVTRQLLSLNLPDGGNQLLPLDTVRYRYVGFETF